MAHRELFHTDSSQAAAETVFIRRVLVPEGLGYKNVDVTLSEGKIAAVEEDGKGVCPPGAIIIDGFDKLLLPGMVNAHTHSSEHWARGLIKPLPLELWLHELVLHEPRGEEGGKLIGLKEPMVDCPSELIGVSCLHAGLETLMGGATAIMDHIFVRDINDVEAAVKAYRSLGIRCFLALMLGDTEGIPTSNYLACCPNAKERNARARACGCGLGGLGEGGLLREEPNRFSKEKEDAAFALWEEAVLRFHRPEDGVNIAVGPQTCYAASPSLIRRGAELRKKHNLAGHIHLLETQGQKLQSRQYFGEDGAIGMLRDTGFLSLPGTSCAHAVWLDDKDIKMLSEAGATIVHNPASNLRLGSGVAPIRKYLAEGVNVCLGCDGACSSDGQDMLEVLKLTALIHTLSTREYRDWLEPAEVVRMATENGYKAVDMEGKAGVIKAGAEADLCMYDLTVLSMLPRTDPMGMLVLGRPGAGGPGGAALAQCWVRGRRVIKDGVPITCDVVALRERLLSVYPTFRDRNLTDPRAFPHTAAAEVEYRNALGLDGGSVRPADEKEAARLCDGYPPGCTLDDRTRLP